MDIEHKNAYLRKNLAGHPKGKGMHLSKVILTIGIIIHGIIVIIVDNMVTFHKISLGHISKEITRNGLMESKIGLVVTRLDM